MLKDSSIDLMASITGSAQDFKLILDYLPAYLPQFTRFHNVMGGISLGGHTTYQIASMVPGQLEGFVVVVGCPNLSSLLLTRLGINAADLDTTSSELDRVSYEKIERVMNDQQRRRWPPALAKLVSESDRKVREEFPPEVPMLICCGKQDPLVPAFYTAEWLKKRREEGRSLGNETFFVQENTGHSCTKEMVAMIAGWLGKMFETQKIAYMSAATESHL